LLFVNALQGQRRRVLDEAETPMFPSWFITDDFEPQTLRVETRRLSLARMSAWADIDDADFKMSPPEFVLPIITSSPVTPVKRVMALRYIVDAGDLYGFTDMDDGKVGVGEVNMPVPWLRT
jgi:hypothetical protein